MHVMHYDVYPGGSLENRQPLLNAAFQCIINYAELESPSYWSAFWTSRFPFSELIEGLRDPCQHLIRIQGSTPLSPNLTHGYWCEVTQKVREWHLYYCQAYFCGFPWPARRVLLLHLPVVKHHVTFQPKVPEIFQSERVFSKVKDLLTLLFHCCLRTHHN